MLFLKEWWQEIALLIGFLLLTAAWACIYPILEEYDANAPLYFYFFTEVGWCMTAGMTALYGVGGKGWFRIAAIKAASKNDPGQLRGKAWFWFRMNRAIALLQPLVTALLVATTSAPWGVKFVIGAILSADMAHTFWVIWRSKVWEKKV